MVIAPFILIGALPAAGQSISSAAPAN